MNPHALIRALAPQASASANSATRTSARGTVAKRRPGFTHRAPGPSGARMGPWTPHRETRPRATRLRPRGRGRRPVPRPDPDRHLQLRRRRRAGGAQGGRARRRAARRGRHRERGSTRPTPGRTNVVARWGGGGRATPLLLHGHLDVVPAAADGLAGRPVLRRGPRRLRLGPRRGRHEGLRRDAAVGRARPRPRRRGARPADRALLHRRRGGRRAPRRAGRWSSSTRSCFEGCTEAVGEVGGFSATVRGRRVYLIEAAEKGMAWMRLTARGRAGHGSMINHDNAVTALAARRRPDRRPPVAGAAHARRWRCCWPRSAELAGTEATPENAEALVEEFGGAARMLGAVHPQHRQPDDARRRLQGQRDPDRGHRARRRPVPARLRGRVLRDPRRARAATDVTIELRVASSRPGRRRTTATWSTR